jgi:hypothetical protein
MGCSCDPNADDANSPLCPVHDAPSSSPVFNVVWIEPVPMTKLIDGERWVQLRCHHSGKGTPLLVQLPEREWAIAVMKSKIGA